MYANMSERMRAGTTMSERGAAVLRGKGMSRPLMSTQEVAIWSNNSTRKILDLARAGLIGRKVGGRWYYSPDQVEEFFGVTREGRSR